MAVCADCHTQCGWKVTVGAGKGKDQTVSVTQMQEDGGLDAGLYWMQEALMGVGWGWGGGVECVAVSRWSFLALCCLAQTNVISPPPQ